MYKMFSIQLRLNKKLCLYCQGAFKYIYGPLNWDVPRNSLWPYLFLFQCKIHTWKDPFMVSGQHTRSMAAHWRTQRHGKRHHPSKMRLCKLSQREIQAHIQLVTLQGKLWEPIKVNIVNPWKGKECSPNITIEHLAKCLVLYKNWF